MLCSAVLRGHALSAVPLAAASGTRRCQTHRSALLHAHSLRSLLSRETLDCRIPFSFFSLNNFSSNPNKPTSDADLLRIIDYKTRCDDHDREEETAESFSSEIQVERSNNATTFMRNCHMDKYIGALASMPSLKSKEEHENSSRIERDEMPIQSSVPLTGNVSKQEGDNLGCCCTDYTDELVNDRMSFKESEESGEKMPFYEGVSFRQEEEVEYPQKQEQKEGWQGERFHLLKSRGQHLLTNPRILDSIVRKAKVLPTDTVLEIGPGTGNLTIRLLECAEKVIAVEIDERMVDALQNRVAKLGLEDKLVVIMGNALKMEFPHFDLCVANIPYGISSPLIAKLFVKPLKSCFRSATLLLQKEFAHRLLAKPGDSDFNRLAVNVGLVASVDFLMNVSKKDFVPSPKVDSSLVRIQPKLNVPYINIDEWLGFTRTLFCQKNKTLGAIFKQKKKIIELYEKSKSSCMDMKTFKCGDRANDYDVNDNSESDDADICSSSLDLEGQNSTEIFMFKEKIVRILKDGGFGEKRPSKLSNEEFLCLLQLFNKEGVFFQHEQMELLEEWK